MLGNVEALQFSAAVPKVIQSLACYKSNFNGHFSLKHSLALLPALLFHLRYMKGNNHSFARFYTFASEVLVNMAAFIKSLKM